MKSRDNLGILKSGGTNGSIGDPPIHCKQNSILMV